jgi:hypothetical protein
MRKMLVTIAVAVFAMTGIVLASAPASAEPKPAPAPAGPMHAPCGTTAPNLENRVEADAPLSGAVNQRNGTRANSSTDCVILGQLQPTDDALYYCYTVGNDGFLWTYLRNQRTGVRGWSRDNLLDFNANGTQGSVRYCGF